MLHINLTADPTTLLEVGKEKSQEEKEMIEVFKEMVEDMKSTMPVVTYLRDPSLQQRHWDEIFEIVGHEMDLEN